MHIIKIVITISILLMTTIIAAEPDTAELKSNTVILASDYKCPYACYPNDENQGYLVELAKEAFKIFNINIEYRMMPWCDAIKLAQAGNIHGVIGISDTYNKKLITTQRPQTYSFTTVFVTNNTYWVYDGPESLQGKKLYIILDDDMSPDVYKYTSLYYISNRDLLTIQDNDTALISVVNNLCQQDSTSVYVGHEKVVEKYINNNNLSQYVKNAGRVNKQPQPIYIAFSTKNPNTKKYLQMLENGINHLDKNGVLNNLKAKYNIEE